MRGIAKGSILIGICIALLLCGCGANRETLYLPTEDGALKTVSARAGDGPEGLMDALYRAGALPKDAGGYLYCAAGAEAYALHGVNAVRRVVRLDISDGLGKALAEMEDERPCVQAMVNTFLVKFDAEVLVLTVEGVNLQTLRANYDHGILFDEYAATKEG